jgi:hypothetical protein
LAPTREKLCAALSAQPARGSCSYRNKILPRLEPEQFFAKLTHWLRKAAQRSSDAVCGAIGHILKKVSPTECSNYLENAGYDEM